MVIVPLREPPVELAATQYHTVPFPAPKEFEVMITQETLLIAVQVHPFWAAWTFEGDGEKRIKATKKIRWKILKCPFTGIKNSTFPKPIWNATEIMLISPWL